MGNRNRQAVWQREESAHDEQRLEREQAQLFYKSLSVKKARNDYLALCTDISTEARILEIGCGEGDTLVYLHSLGYDAVGIDISARIVEEARENLKAAGFDPNAAMHMNAETLDFPDDTFDIICGKAILHHLTDLTQMASTLYRILRPGGKCVFLEPLGHNPGLSLYRKLTPGRRTADEHALLVRNLKQFFERFDRNRVRPYLFLGLGASAVLFLTRNMKAFRLFDVILYPFDRMLLSIPGPHKYWAFTCTLEAWKKK